MKFHVWCASIGEDEHDALTVDAELAVDAVRQIALLDLVSGVRMRADWCVRVRPDLVLHIETDENARTKSLRDARSA